MKKTIIWTLSTLLALAMAGCGAGSGSDSNQAEATPEAARTARLTLTAAFASSGAATKALIDPRITSITVEYYDAVTYEIAEVSLTPDDPTVTLELTPGLYSFFAYGYDADQRLVDAAMSSGTLTVGANRVTLTFLAGSWTFVNAQGQPAPIELSSGAGSLLLDGFELRSMGYGYGDAAAQAGSKAIYEGEHGGYVLSWASRAAGTPGTPFSDLTRLTYAYHYSGFSGMNNTSAFGGGFYDLTEGCGEFDPFWGSYLEDGSWCSEGAGSRLIQILGMEDEWDEEFDYDPLLPDETETVDGEPVDLTGYENGTVAAADRITGSLAEVNILSSEVEIVYPTAQATKAAEVNLTDRAGALRALLAGAGKTAQSSNTPTLGLTATWAEHAVVCSDLDSDGTVDQGDWDFSYSEAVDVDGDGTPDAWFDGYLPWGSTNPGECSTGLTLAQGGDPGEWVDSNNNGVIDPWELWDRDGDDVVQTGDIQVEHYLLYTEVLDVWIYSFAATGTSGTQGVFTIESPYVQYRTFEDPASNRYTAWANVMLSGGPVFESDFLDGSITGPDGELTIPDGNALFYASPFLFASWNASQGRFGTLNASFNTGFSVNLSDYDTLPAGDYTINLVTATGGTVSATVNLPSTTALPVVDSSTMQATWEQDGSLTLAWEAPTGSFDQYRLVFSSYNYLQGMDTQFFYGSIAPGITSITIPADQVQEFEAFFPSGYLESPTWMMQTRNYTDGHNYARGISNPVPLPDPGAAQ